MTDTMRARGASIDGEVTQPMLVRPLATGTARPCLVVMSGPRIGELLAIGEAPGGLLIGRAPTMHLRLPDDGVSRRHARIDVEEGAVILSDLDSTNGTWVAGMPVSQHRLAQGDKIRLGQAAVLRFGYLDAVEEACQRQLIEAALRDGLTQAFNRRYFFERLAAEAAYADRKSRPVALLMIDVDRFKAINERLGHVAGDAVLARVADVIDQTVRTDDMLARFGGEEFVVLARDTPLEGGLRFAERIRGAIAATQIQHQQENLRVTVSIGVGVMRGGGDHDPLDLLERADEALYRAKRDGRNRVCL